MTNPLWAKSRRAFVNELSSYRYSTRVRNPKNPTGVSILNMSHEPWAIRRRKAPGETPARRKKRMMSLTRRHSASRGVRPARRRNERPRERRECRCSCRTDRGEYVPSVRPKKDSYPRVLAAVAAGSTLYAVGDRARGVQGRVRLLQRARERGVPGARLQPRGRFHVGGPRGRRAFGTEARAPSGRLGQTDETASGDATPASDADVRFMPSLDSRRARTSSASASTPRTTRKIPST